MASAGAYALAHVLLVAALLSFGQAAGGYPLEPLAVLPYGLMTLAATAVAFWLTARAGSKAGADGLLPLLSMVLFLTIGLLGTYFATEKLPPGALARLGLARAYTPTLDDDGGFALFNWALAAGLVGLALATRWRGLLVWCMAGQGLALLFNPGLLMPNPRYGLDGDAYGLLALPFFYLAAALMLGWRPRVVHYCLPPLLLASGFLLAGFLTLPELRRTYATNAWFMEKLLATGWFYAFVLTLPYFAWRARTWCKGGVSPSWQAAAGASVVLLALSAVFFGGLAPPIWLGDSRRLPEELYGAAGDLLRVMKVIYPWLLGVVGLTWLTSILRTSWPSIVDPR